MRLSTRFRSGTRAKRTLIHSAMLRVQEGVQPQLALIVRTHAALYIHAAGVWSLRGWASALMAHLCCRCLPL